MIILLCVLFLQRFLASGRSSGEEVEDSRFKQTSNNIKHLVTFDYRSFGIKIVYEKEYSHLFKKLTEKRSILVDVTIIENEYKHYVLTKAIFNIHTSCIGHDDQISGNLLISKRDFEILKNKKFYLNFLIDRNKSLHHLSSPIFAYSETFKVVSEKNLTFFLKEFRCFFNLIFNHKKHQEGRFLDQLKKYSASKDVCLKKYLIINSFASIPIDKEQIIDLNYVMKFLYNCFKQNYSLIYSRGQLKLNKGTIQETITHKEVLSSFEDSILECDAFEEEKIHQGDIASFPAEQNEGSSVHADVEQREVINTPPLNEEIVGEGTTYNQEEAIENGPVEQLELEDDGVHLNNTGKYEEIHQSHISLSETNINQLSPLYFINCKESTYLYQRKISDWDCTDESFLSHLQTEYKDILVQMSEILSDLKILTKRNSILSLDCMIEDETPTNNKRIIFFETKNQKMSKNISNEVKVRVFYSKDGARGDKKEDYTMLEAREIDLCNYYDDLICICLHTEMLNNKKVLMLMNMKNRTLSHFFDCYEYLNL